MRNYSTVESLIQCLADGSPVTDFPSVTPAEAVRSYLEIA